MVSTMREALSKAHETHIETRREAMIAQAALTLAEAGVRRVAALDEPDAVTHVGVSRCDPRVIVLRRAPKPSGPYVDTWVVIEDEAIAGHLNEAICCALDPRVGPRFTTMRDLAAHLAWLAGDIDGPCPPRPSRPARLAIDGRAAHV